MLFDVAAMVVAFGISVALLRQGAEAIGWLALVVLARSAALANNPELLKVKGWDPDELEISARLV